GCCRIRVTDTGENLPGPHQGGQSPTQRGRKTKSCSRNQQKKAAPTGRLFCFGAMRTKIKSKQQNIPTRSTQIDEGEWEKPTTKGKGPGAKVSPLLDLKILFWFRTADT
ncbi:hypothetical protein, partial [uncultured Roseibium sp.]|uniref:hypothetical protein n=1 Tax=uncultured Roseibium sp. TaxID=1936171 RepID=UPI00262D7D92